jgi:hypothetical protein
MARSKVVDETPANSFGKGEAPEPASAGADAVPGESGTGTTGPPPDQGSLPQNGAPPGAVSVSEAPQVNRLPASRLVARPKKRGRAPIGDDGYPVELHHHDQVQGGMVSEMTRSDHRLGENYRRNHPNTGRRPSLIDRVRANRERYNHWAGEWDKTRFDNLPEASKTQMEGLQRAAKARINPPLQRSNE